MRLAEVFPGLDVKLTVEGHLQITKALEVNRRIKEILSDAHLMMWFSGVRTVIILAEHECIMTPFSLPSWLALDSRIFVNFVLCSADSFCLQTSMNYINRRVSRLLHIRALTPICLPFHTPKPARPQSQDARLSTGANGQRQSPTTT